MGNVFDAHQSFPSTNRGEEERQALRKLIRDEMKKVLDEMGLVTKEDLKELLKKQD